MAKTTWVADDKGFDPMKCPECCSIDVKYLDSYTEDGRSLDERYRCPDCGCEYTVTSAPVELTVTKERQTMTWRDVKKVLDGLTDDELGMQALVWTPADFERHGELTPVVRLDPSTDPDCGINEDNPLSFTLNRA